jgi:hypothetical protein
MTAALSWVNDLVQWLGRWVPRLVLVEPTHRGVRFGPRGSAREVGPGLVVYWPITHVLLQVPVTTQSIQLSTQVLPCVADAGVIPRVMLCSAALQFRVASAVAASTRALSLHALVDNRAQAAIARHVGNEADRPAWAAAVLFDLRLELEPFGVVVERLDFTQNGIGVALKNVSDWNYADRQTGTRPD